MMYCVNVDCTIRRLLDKRGALYKVYIVLLYKVYILQISWLLFSDAVINCKKYMLYVTSGYTKSVNSPA